MWLLLLLMLLALLVLAVLVAAKKLQSPQTLKPLLMNQLVERTGWQWRMDGLPELTLWPQPSLVLNSIHASCNKQALLQADVLALGITRESLQTGTLDVQGVRADGLQLDVPLLLDCLSNSTSNHENTPPSVPTFSRPIQLTNAWLKLSKDGHSVTLDEATLSPFTLPGSLSLNAHGTLEPNIASGWQTQTFATKIHTNVDFGAQHWSLNELDVQAAANTQALGSRQTWRLQGDLSNTTNKQSTENKQHWDIQLKLHAPQWPEVLPALPTRMQRDQPVDAQLTWLGTQTATNRFEGDINARIEHRQQHIHAQGKHGDLLAWWEKQDFNQPPPFIGTITADALLIEGVMAEDVRIELSDQP